MSVDTSWLPPEARAAVLTVCAASKATVEMWPRARRLASWSRFKRVATHGHGVAVVCRDSRESPGSERPLKPRSGRLERP